MGSHFPLRFMAKLSEERLKSAAVDAITPRPR